MRRIVFFGNCQAGAYGNLFRRLIAPETGDHVTVIGMLAAFDREQVAAVEQADIIVSQLFDNKQQNDLSGVRARGRIIEFPNFYLGFLWPYCGRPRTVKGSSAQSALRYRRELGDLLLDGYITDGLSPDDVVRRYFDADCTKNIDRVIEIYLDRQELRDEKTGFETHRIIAERYRTERLCFSPGHPGLRITRYIAGEIFRRLDIDQAAIGHCLGSLMESPFPKFTRPIHPSVVAHLGLSYGHRDELIEMDDGELVSHETWIWRYATNYSRTHLLDAVTKVNSLSGDPSSHDAVIAELRAALAQHGPSNLGQSVLGHQLIRRGDLPGALAAFQQAALIAPANPRSHHQLANIFRLQGRLAEADAEMRRASACQQA